MGFLLGEPVVYIQGSSPPYKSVLAINGRFYTRERISGVERYAREVVSRLPLAATVYRPQTGAAAGGHFWEQVILPGRIGRDTLLFNPCNLAPLAHRRNLITLHDAIPFAYPEFYRPAYRAYYTAVVRLLARRAVHLITVSEFSRQQILRYLGVAESRVSVIANGVDSRFDPARRDPQASVLRRLGLTPPYILYTGSIEPRKNVGVLLAAFAAARRQGRLDGVQLAIAGNRYRLFAESDLGQDRPEVRWLGYVDDRDLPVLYASAELFVYPSLCEGFGLPPSKRWLPGWLRWLLAVRRFRKWCRNRNCSSTRTRRTRLRKCFAITWKIP